MTIENGGDAEPTPEERRTRIEANLAKAEQRRIDSERARADYQAENDALNANMARLRALRLAKQELDQKAAAEAAAMQPPPEAAKRPKKKRALPSSR